MSLLDFQLHPPKAAQPYADLDNYSQKQLLELRQEVYKRLEGVRLSDINVAKELLISLKQAQLLQEEVGKDHETPANQKAQVQNSLGTILARLAALQNKTYDSEQNKRMEAALIRVLKDFPDIRDKFLDSYTFAVTQDLANEGLGDE